MVAKKAFKLITGVFLHQEHVLPVLEKGVVNLDGCNRPIKSVFIELVQEIDVA